MMDAHVSAAAMGGLVFSALISIGVPAALFIYLKVKWKANIWPFFAGCIVWVMFVLILENMLHVLVLSVCSARGFTLQEHIWLYGIYGGLAAGLFEETGRYWAMYIYMRKEPKPVNALMYGAGHGGAEAILLVGINYIIYIVVALLINNGMAGQWLEQGVDETLIEQLIALFQDTEPAVFFIAGLERLLAVALHIMLSVIVYRSVLEKRLPYYVLAVALHAGIDCVIVWLAALLPSLFLVEAVLALLLIPTGIYAYRAYRALQAAAG